MSAVTTPAVCGVNACGVAAIGRCATCGNAFCGSHQGRSVYGVFVDQCGPCRVRIEQAEREHESQYGRWFFSGGGARKMLLAAHVPTVELYTVESTWESRRFGRSRSVETVVPLGRGWLLGPFLWEFNDGGNYGGSDITDACETMLLDREEKPGYGEGGLSGFWGSDFLVRVTAGPHGYLLLYVRSRGVGSFKGNWEQLAQRVHDLSAAP